METLLVLASVILALLALIILISVVSLIPFVTISSELNNFFADSLVVCSFVVTNFLNSLILFGLNSAVLILDTSSSVPIASSTKVVACAVVNTAVEPDGAGAVGLKTKAPSTKSILDGNTIPVVFTSPLVVEYLKFLVKLKLAFVKFVPLLNVAPLKSASPKLTPVKSVSEKLMPG